MKPYVILNAAMTLDGKIASKSGDSELSCKEDWERVYKLRASVDGIMVGINTVLKDNPSLTSKGYGKNPVRIIVDSKARTPLNARVLNDESSTIIAVSRKAKESKLKELRKKAEVIVCGDDLVDLSCLLKKLYDMGIKSILLEGGGTLNWSMLKNGLVDRVIVSIAPYIVGGRDAVTLVEGEGFNKIREGIRLNLVKFYKLGEDLILEYDVVNTDKTKNKEM